MAAHSIGLFAILLYILVQITTQNHISDQRLCGNNFCSVTLSLAKAIVDYDGSLDDKKLLKFKANDVVKITSKSAGSRKDLWGGEVGGVEGFFPKSTVKEYKVFMHNPSFAVKIESTDKIDSDDDTDLDETDIDAQDIVKPAPKKEEKKEELKASEVSQKEAEKKDESPKEAEAKEDKPTEEKQDVKKPDEPIKKETDETELDDTEVPDPTEVPAQDKKDEKPSEPAVGTPEKAADAKSSEQVVESAEPAAKPSGGQPGTVDEKSADQLNSGTPGDQPEVMQLGKQIDNADPASVKADDVKIPSGSPVDQPEVVQPSEQVNNADQPNVKADVVKIPTGSPVGQPDMPEVVQPGEQIAKPAEQQESMPEGKTTGAEKQEGDKQTSPEPSRLKIADIKVTVQEPDAVGQPGEEVPKDRLDLKPDGNSVHMDIGNVPQKNQDQKKRLDMTKERPSDVPTGVPELSKSQDDSISLNKDEPKESVANQPTELVTPTPVDQPAGGATQTPVAQPSEGIPQTPAELETKIEPTLASLESAKPTNTDFHFIKPDVTETHHPAATDLPDTNKDQPKEPHEPAVSGEKEIVKEELKVTATPSLQPSQPNVETESTDLSEDELKSQKLLEELERGPTESLQPSLKVETTRQQESMTKPVESSLPSQQESIAKPVEPSLPHEVPVKTKHVKPTPRIVLHGERTVTSSEDNRLKVPDSTDTPIGTVVEKPAHTEGSIHPTPTDTLPKETATPESKPEAPHVEDRERTDESDSVTASPQVEPPSVEQQTPSASEPTPQSESGPESSTMSTLTRTAEPLVGAIISSLPEEWRLILEKEPIGLPPTHTVLFLLICLIFSFIVSIRCMCSGGDKAMVKLKERLQKVEYDLFVANKEKESLAQSIHDAEDKASNSTSSMSNYEETNKRLQLDVSNLQLHNSALKQSVPKLEENVSTLSQSLECVQTSLAQKEQESIEYQNQVYQLQEHTTQLEYQVQQAQGLLIEKQTIAEEMEGSNAALNEEITILQQSKQQLLVEADDWNEKVKELEGTVGCLEGQTRELQDAVSFKENEIEVLKDCFMQLKVLETENENENDESGGEPGNSKLQEKVAAMINVSRMNAILQQVEEDKAALQQKVVIEMESRQEMEEQVKHIKQEMEELKMNHSKAEKESTEAMTKLSVLSTYFKEKELQMQKELGEQLTQKKAKEGQLEEFGEKTNEIEKEMSMYRSQVEDLKKEISSIERDFRNQIATNEKKAHENWLLARAAERDLKEAKAESAILRQKLTDIERRREFMGPEGLIRPLPTRGMPPPMMMNGPPPPPPGAPDGRPLSRSSGIQPSPSPHHLREGELGSPNFDRLPPPPLDRRPFPPPDRPFMPMDRPLLPPGRLPMDRPLPPPLDRRMPPMMNMRSPPPHDRRPAMDPSPPFDRDPDRRYPPPPERFPPDRRSPPPFRPDMMPPPRMGPGGPPPYPGPGMRGPPPPRREPFPPEPYMERQGPGRPSSIPPHERPPSLPPQDRDHYGPPPPRERQQSFV